MGQTKLCLFGSPRLEQAGQVIDISLRKALALLVYLAVTRRAHSRDALATLLWPDSDQRRARANLRRTLHRLNRALGPGILEATSEAIGLAPEADLWLDIEAFQRSVATCLDPDAAADLSPDCLSHLSEAAGLYSDDFLAGFTLPDCPGFDEWQFFQAENLRQTFVQVLIRLIAAHQAKTEFEPAIRSARRWLALDPLHEPAQCKLIQLYDQAGQPTAALRQYRECARLFEDELGLPPSEETTTLYEAIKAKHLLAPFVKEAVEEGNTASSASPAAPPSHPPAPTYPYPEVRYVKSGEVHIAYQVLGEGPVDLVFIGGFVAHLEQYWEEPGLAEFFQHLASLARLILFDKRGVGLSDRVGYPPTLEHTMDDTLAVMDAVNSERAVLLGVSQGGPNSALLAATYPERVSALILYGTFAKWLRSPDHPWGWTPAQVDQSVNRYATHWGGPVRLDYFAPSRAGDERFKQWWAKLLRLASSPGSVKAVLEVSTEIDIRHILLAIHVPTLVLHRTGDRIAHVEAGRYMAHLIPGARFVELSGQDHFWWVGDAGAILAEIERFLNALKQSTPADRMLVTILSTEIFPAVAQEQAEDQRQARLANYQTQVREEIARFRGRKIEQSDRHVLAAFDGPSRAIQCAITLRALAQARGMTIRGGLHCGECESSEGVLGGVAIQIAAGVMDKAPSGKILVSNTVKDLVVGSDFAFEAQGVYKFKGILDEWRLFVLKP
jgi:DNA-binding SARP family transcriptional activator/pimeloyl-ACP methyl ester carboxylesterase